MLKVIDSLEVFFEDNYREYSVREYSREMKISPPTASKILKSFAENKILLLREERGFLLFRINRENKIASDLSRIYWSEKLKKLIEFLNDELYGDSLVLFGSLSKLEATKDSDLDIAVFTKLKKDVDLSKFEKELGRVIQIFSFESLDKVNKELRTNIINGYILGGYLV